MPGNDAAAPGHVCAGVRIHTIDMVRRPGISISPIADMDSHQAIVSAALAARSSAETPTQARWDTPRLRSALVVLVVAAPPDARLVAAPGGAVEPLVHAPETVHSARIGGIGVVDHAVLERERAHAWSLAYVGVHIGSAHGGELTGSVRRRARRYRGDRFLAFVVVFDPLALFLLRE